ncbi:MAG TPA: ATP-binding protein [Polyangia bacterium]|nr:ATP-binding protein [Polyangia bacterium]
MAAPADLQEENRILRERLEQVARGGLGLVDPVMRALMDNLPAFLNVITPEGRTVATGRTSEAFGSVVGRSVFEFANADQHEGMRAAYARVCATKQPTTYETIAYGENGEPNHTYLVRVVPLIEKDAVSLLMLIPTDITERARLERSLTLSEEKLRLAVESTRVGLWSWDMERDEIVWDARALEVFGASAPPRDYEAFLALIHLDDRAMVRDIIGRAREVGVYTPFEHRVAVPGPERWVLGTGTIVRDGRGTPIAMMGGVIDITAQKHAAAQVQRAQRVEALGQLSAGLAHNFNNLLGAIIPNLELAREVASPEQDESLKPALDASVQARDLVKRLMSLTAPRASTGANVCDPREVVERSVALCRASFPREIQLMTDLAPGVGAVAMGASDLDQILLNLLFNARDALEATTGRERRIEVMLDAPTTGAGRREARLRVRDNGSGMTEAVAARIFEPFFTTKPAHRGAGLGLADVLLRVREVGGRLEHESTPGEGTTFTVVLPITDASLAAPPAPSARASEGRRQLILVVDDEQAVRTVVVRLLTRQGYRVLEADSAEMARELLRSAGRDVELVLLDQSMPHESGPEALPSLKQLTSAPVVLFTGGLSEPPAGVAAVLRKPAQAAEVLGVVERFTGASR